MPRPRRPTTPRDRWCVAYWATALLVYTGLGVFFQPFFLLGFWESVPFVFGVTWLAGRLFGRTPTDPGPGP